MNKKMKSLILVASSLLIGACSNATIDEERTIILEIDSDIVPNFTSNFGDGSYDNSTNKYTHTISSIKDLYITLSYEDLKSLTVHIPTSEMTQQTIIKEIEFGENLDAEVEVTVEGVKSLDGLEITNDDNIKNLKIGQKNKFKFTLPSRDEDYTLNFTLPGYKNFELGINKDSLISGMAQFTTIAINTEQIYVALEGNNYSYKIYSSSTNKLLASGSKDSYNKNREYIVLDNTDSYYAYTYSYNDGKENLYKIDQNEDFIIKHESDSYEYHGWLDVMLDNEHYYRSYSIYDKVNKRLTGSSIYNNLSSLGLLVQEEYNKWVYFDELVTRTENDDTYTQYFDLDFSKAIPVEFNVTRIHNFTNEIISSEIESNFWIYNNFDSIELDGNVFNVTIHENETANVNISVYDNEDNYLTDISVNIKSNFNGEIMSGTISHNGQKIPYNFPLFKEDLQYSNGSFTYTGKVNISTDISLVEFIFFNDYAYPTTLSQSAYVMSPDGSPILQTNIGDNKSYFELEANVHYTLYNDDKPYEFTLTNEDMERGQVIFYDSSLSIVKVKVHENYSLNLHGTDLTPDANGIINFPYRNDSSDIELCLNNGIVQMCIYKRVQENQTIELDAFYSIDISSIYDHENYDANYTYNYDTETYFYYIEWLNGKTPIKTGVHENDYNNYVYIESTDFTYNDDLNCYYYSFEEKASYVLSGNLYSLNVTNYYRYNAYYYLRNDSTVEYNGVIYDLSQYNGKYLEVSFGYVDGNYQPNFSKYK